MKFRKFFSLAVFVSVAVSAVSGEAAPGKSKKLEVRTTAYTHTEADHLKYGRKNAAGGWLRSGKTYTSAAADWSRFPLGTTFKIKGIDSTFVIDDYGRALVGTDTIDLYHTSRCSMNRWGARRVEIEILKFGDYEKSREILKDRTHYAHVRKMLAGIPEKQPPGMMDRLLARIEAKPEKKSEVPAAPSLPPKTATSKPAAPPSRPETVLAAKTPAPSPAPKAPAPKPAASPPAATPAPVLMASKAPEPEKPAASIQTPLKPLAPKPASLQPAEAALAWEKPLPKPAPLVAAAAPASSTLPAPAAAPSPQPRKFLPIEIASYDQPSRPEVAREQPDAANTLRERRFRPLPAVWRRDI